MSQNPDKSEPKPTVDKARRWNIVWVMPVIALLIGSWLLYRNFATSGPVATISFETAEGIKAGQTEIRCRSVKVGMVREVKLTKDLNSVMIVAEFNKDAEALLRDSTQFWVVKPRLSAAEISGLGTLIQGVYIELDPGPRDGKLSDKFVGLETPPATNSSVPGRRITLTTREAGQLQIGAPIYYRGFDVGRIESRELSKNGRLVSYEAFIEDEYSHLLTANCRFWNSSGLEIDAGATGVVVRTPSIESMLSGGVTFGLAEGMVGPGPICEDGDAFTLYADKDAARRSTFTPTLKFLLLFDQSVRGLTVNSPVEFRGIPIGRITRISFELVDSHADPRIPVLVEIDPSLCRPMSEDITIRPDTIFFLEEAEKGLRAGLKTSSLLTGEVHIDFDYHPHAPASTIGKMGDYATFPTVTGGFAQLETKISSLIQQIEDVGLDDTMKNLAGAADSARNVFEDPDFQKLPAELKDSLQTLNKAVASIGPDGEIHDELQLTLKELRATLQSLKAVADLLEDKPNALIFGKGRDDEEGSNNDSGPSRTGPRSR